VYKKRSLLLIINRASLYFIGHTCCQSHLRISYIITLNFTFHFVELQNKNFQMSLKWQIVTLSKNVILCVIFLVKKYHSKNQKFGQRLIWRIMIWKIFIAPLQSKRCCFSVSITLIEMGHDFTQAFFRLAANKGTFPVYFDQTRRYFFDLTG